MIVLFILLFIIASELTYSVATQPLLGYNPYPFGTPIICVIIHVLILVNCIFYLGWLIGIILFICHMITIPHMTIGWVFALPSLFFTSEKQYFKYFNLQLSSLIPLLIVLIAFFVISIFVSEYSCLYDSLESPVLTLIIIVVALTIMSFIRKLTFKALSNDNL